MLGENGNINTPVSTHRVQKAKASLIPAIEASNLISYTGSSIMPEGRSPLFSPTMVYLKYEDM